MPAVGKLFFVYPRVKLVVVLGLIWLLHVALPPSCFDWSLKFWLSAPSTPRFSVCDVWAVRELSNRLKDTEFLRPLMVEEAVKLFCRKIRLVKKFAGPGRICAGKPVFISSCDWVLVMSSL